MFPFHPPSDGNVKPSPNLCSLPPSLSVPAADATSKLRLVLSEIGAYFISLLKTGFLLWFCRYSYVEARENGKEEPGLGLAQGVFRSWWAAWKWLQPTGTRRRNSPRLSFPEEEETGGIWFLKDVLASYWSARPLHFDESMKSESQNDVLTTELRLCDVRKPFLCSSMQCNEFFIQKKIPSFP